jgi:hypothetical protein
MATLKDKELAGLVVFLFVKGARSPFHAIRCIVQGPFIL